MRTATKLAGIAVMAVSALALSACSGASPEPAKTTAAADSVSLRMTTWTANPDQLALFGKIADAYKKTHPEIKSITFDSLPYADYTSTLTTQIAGGSAPDLAWVLDTDATDFVKSGVLAPLTDTLKATKGYDYNDIDASASKLWTSDKNLYAYPFSTSPFVVFANDALLKQAGEPTSADLQSQGKWDLKDIADVASQVNAKTGQGGIIVNNFNYQDWTLLSTIWNAWGAAPWSADGSKCTFTSSKMKDAFSFINKAIFDQNAIPGPGTNLNFFSGGSAFVITQISSANLLPAAGFEWNMLPLPGRTSGAANHVIGQAGVGVLAKGKHAQEAQDFLAYFTDPSNAKKLAQYFPPPRTSLRNAATLAATNPVLSKTQLNDVVIPSLKNAVTRPGHVNQTQIASEVKTALTPMWKQGADVSPILGNVCSSVKSSLAG
jgi:multiple sugar transport system substrate-binding protein